MYENNQKDKNVAKKIILEFLDYLRYKVESDKLTMEETRSIARVIDEGLTLSGTADDFAEFYGQSRDNVKVVISRKLLDKPRRRVFYRFNTFRRVIPESWRDRHRGGGNAYVMIYQLIRAII